MFFNYNTFQFYIKPGYIDMRKGIPGLTLFIQEMMNLNPFSENTMFLFCGKNNVEDIGIILSFLNFVSLMKSVRDSKSTSPTRSLNGSDGRIPVAHNNPIKVFTVSLLIPSGEYKASHCCFNTLRSSHV